MAQSLVGKWKPDHSSLAEAEEFFTALGQPDAYKDFGASTELEITVDGNTITSVTQITNKEPRTDVTRVGETDDITLPGSPVMQAKSRQEGDRVVSDIYVGDNLVMTFARHVKDNVLISEVTANGKTLTLRSVRA